MHIGGLLVMRCVTHTFVSFDSRSLLSTTFTQVVLRFLYSRFASKMYDSCCMF